MGRKVEPVISLTDNFRFEAINVANHFLTDAGRRALISLITLPVGTPVEELAAATAIELAPTPIAVTIVAATAFAGCGTQMFEGKSGLGVGVTVIVIVLDVAGLDYESPGQ
ncbi:MAG: hypothetical protein V3R57_06920 [Candidatus Bathyarchaeia archaeon]